MSKSQMSTGVSALDAMTGHRMPGGCDDCDAYQTVTRESAGMYRLLVHHDHYCPWFNGVTK